MTEEDVGAELVVVENRANMTLFQTDNPVEVLEKATEVATALAAVIEAQKLYVGMGKGKKHPTIEAWTLLGSMLGVFARPVWTRPITIGGKRGWEARVEVVTMDGAVIGGREAMCMAGESQQWHAGSEDHALRSMAQTRANSAALASVLRFVMILGGYQGTPEAELTDDMRQATGTPAAPQKPAPSAWDMLKARIAQALRTDVSEALGWISQGAQAAYGVPLKELTGDEFTAFATDLVVVADNLELADIATDEAPELDVQVPTRAAIQSAFGVVPDFGMLAGPPWAVTETEHLEGKLTRSEWESKRDREASTPGSNGTEPGEPVTMDALNNMTKAELEALADKLDIEVKASWSKLDIREAIIAAHTEPDAEPVPESDIEVEHEGGYE